MEREVRIVRSRRKNGSPTLCCGRSLSSTHATRSTTPVSMAFRLRLSRRSKSTLLPPGGGGGVIRRTQESAGVVHHTGSRPQSSLCYSNGAISGSRGSSGCSVPGPITTSEAAVTATTATAAQPASWRRQGSVRWGEEIRQSGDRAGAERQRREGPTTGHDDGQQPDIELQ